MTNLPTQVHTAMQRLQDAGYEAWLVGGAVRDRVRQLSSVKDWDLATNARPDAVERVFSGCRLIETGLRHGTVTLLLDGLPIEITTYRDGSGGFADRLEEDLAHRDFTVNAMAWCPQHGLLDPFGGRRDCAQHRIRCVGAPSARLREDPLRILRALRFAAVLGMDIDPDTAAACRAACPLLRDVAVERVCSELTRLLCGRDAARVLEAYGDILCSVLPELAPMRGFDQRNPYHDRDVWQHTVAVVGGVPAEPAMRWAALLHDCAKPQCFAADADGIGRMHGHVQKSAETAASVLTRLRADNALRERVVQLVSRHDLTLPLQPPAAKRLLARLGDEAALQLVALRRADIAAQHPSLLGRCDAADETAALLQALIRERACVSLTSLAINGRDLMALGLRGPAIGRALQCALEAVMDETVENDRAALLAYLETHADAALRN